MNRALQQDTPSEEKSGRDKARLRLWLRLLGASQAIEKELRARLRAEHGWTLPRFDVLAALSQHPQGLTMGEISRRLRVSNGNVTGLVDRLLREGQLTRAPSARDRRSYVIALTAEGRENFVRMAEEHRRWIEELTRGLAPAEVEELAGLLARLQEPLRKQSKKETGHAPR